MSLKQYLALVFCSSISVISAFDQGALCGRFPNYFPLDNRVAGGTPTREHEVPWIVSLSNNGDHHCGGSLISSQHVLSAAHCFGQGIEPKNLKVHVGAWNLLNPNNNSIQVVGVEDLIVHNRYKSSRTRNLPENDIAIVKLDQEVLLSDKVWPICLPTASGSNSSILNVVVAGWGTSSFGGDLTDTLRKVDLLTYGDEVCSRAFSGRKILPTHLCAGYLAGGKDACQGDSGGPLYASLTSGIAPRWILLGIVSAGEGCARKDKLGVYTRVSEYLEWIGDQLDDAPSVEKGESKGDFDTPFVPLPGPELPKFLFPTYKQKGYTPQSACTDPQSKPGTCLRLLDCPGLLAVANNPESPDYENLQYSSCGRFANTQHFCCNAKQAVTTQRPTKRQPIETTEPTTPNCGTLTALNYGGCGEVDQFSDRVVGGEKARINSSPWIVLVLLFEVPFCGGSLITNKHVVSAAQCFYKTGEGPRPINQYLLRLAEHDTSTTTDGESLDVSISEVKIHEQFNDRTRSNDIAIIKLNQVLCFSCSAV